LTALAFIALLGSQWESWSKKYEMGGEIFRSNQNNMLYEYQYLSGILIWNSIGFKCKGLREFSFQEGAWTERNTEEGLNLKIIVNYSAQLSVLKVYWWTFIVTICWFSLFNFCWKTVITNITSDLFYFYLFPNKRISLDPYFSSLVPLIFIIIYSLISHD